MYSGRVLFSLIVAVSCALAAPATKGKPKDAPFYPTKAGAKWEYEWPNSQSVIVLKSVESSDGVHTIALFAEEDGKLVLQERLSISDKGVFRVEARGEKVKPALCLLQLPHSNDQQWEWSDEDGGSKVKFRAFGPEEITVPAGKFKAIRVESEFTFKAASGKAKRTDWYVPGLGLIKSAYGKTVIELKKYTPAND